MTGRRAMTNRKQPQDLLEALRQSLEITRVSDDPDYSTDTAKHRFEGPGSFCGRCGETRDWHPEGER